MEEETVIKEIKEMIEITEEKISVSNDDIHIHYLTGYVYTLKLYTGINFNSEDLPALNSFQDPAKLVNSYFEGFHDAELVLDYYREVCKEWN